MKKFLSLFLAVLILFSAAAAATAEAFAAGSDATWSFKTIDGRTVNQSTYKDRTVLLVFFRATMNDGEGLCINSNGTIMGIAESYWVSDPSVKVIAVDVDDVSKSGVQEYKNTYAPDCSDIDFCYGGSETFWKLLLAEDDSGYVGLACCMIFKDGKVRESWQWNYDAETCKHKLSNYVDLGIDPANDLTQISGQFYQTEARKQLDMINSFRAEAEVWYWNEDDTTKTYFNSYGYESLTQLTYDYELEQVAMARAREIALYYDHSRPAGEWFYTLYYNDTLSYGENIAVGYLSSSEVFTAWREDDMDYAGQGHRRNMLTDFNAVGFGCYYHNGIYYWTQEFGYENSGAPATAANNAADTSEVEYSKDLFTPEITYISYDDGTVTLEWNNSYYAYLYGVFRRAEGSDEWTCIGDTEYLYYYDTDVQQGTVYTYAVRSFDFVYSHVEDFEKRSAAIAVGCAAGWKKAFGKWYYFDSKGNATAGWKKISGAWYYFDGSGVMQTGWQQVDGKWYYLDRGGAMLSGWQKISNKWYYFNSGGDMVIGWKQIGGKWYYFNNNGVMQTGWQQIGGKWYYLNAGGDMVSGWQKIGTRWYYFNSGGDMVTGWKKISGEWYYFNSNGVMQTGWQEIGGKTYYLKSSGVMAADEWCKGWLLNADGTWTYQYKASWKKDSKGWYYQDTSGWFARSQTLKIDDKFYTFDSRGYLVE